LPLNFSNTFINLDEIENFYCIFSSVHSQVHVSSIIQKSSSFSLFWTDVMSDCPWPSTPDFPPSPCVPFTKTLASHVTLTLTLVTIQVVHGASRVALITFVLNIHESWLLRVFLIDYKSNRELEKWRQLMKKQCERCFAS
jgi:hypothetical protein